MDQMEVDAQTALQMENARLIALLEAHGIPWRVPPTPPAAVPVSTCTRTHNTQLPILSGSFEVKSQATQTWQEPADDQGSSHSRTPAVQADHPAPNSFS